MTAEGEPAVERDDAGLDVAGEVLLQRCGVLGMKLSRLEAILRAEEGTDEHR
ncbi:hypothetical protein D3C83_317900 [compost metagenome]